MDELKFTLHHDMKEVSFLDTRVILTDTQTLTTDLYIKPTDCNGLLHFQSCHPKHVKNTVP